jgi:hypothetical protein
MSIKRGKRSKREAKIIALRLRISELLLSGYSERMIAKDVNRSPATVHYHVEFLLRQWHEATVRHVGRWIERTLAEYDLITRESWDAWERSKQPQRTEITRARGVGRRFRKDRKVKIEGQLVDVSKNIKLTESAGNPEFLSAVLRVIERRSRLLGLTGVIEEQSKRPEPTDDPYDAPRAKLIAAIAERQR